MQLVNILSRSLLHVVVFYLSLCFKFARDPDVIQCPPWPIQAQFSL